jgi:cell division protein ZipA
VEFDLRDWLLILGPVFISGVLIHGYWRMRRSRSELKMSLDKSFLSTAGEEDTVDDLSFLKAELPNGGARVIPGEPISALDSDELDLSNNVPVLLEPIVVDDGLLVDGSLNEAALHEDGIDSDSDDSQVISPDVLADEEKDSTQDEESAGAKAPPARKEAAIEKPEMFVVINVLAHDEFDGQALREALADQNMIFGEMDIFHRVAEDQSTEFSLVNVVEPGTFNPEQMNEMKTPGVTLFMRAHELPDPIGVYDAMIETAQILATELGGELKDQSRSVMTTQTIEHQRQGIQDFQYKHSA